MERDSRIEIEPLVFEAVERIASAEGSTVADFVNRIVIDRLAYENLEAYLAARAARARPGAIRDWLLQARDEPPVPGDELDPEPPRP